MTSARIEKAGAACAALLAVVFVAMAVHFAQLQNVWVDETTQLSGAALPLGRMISWLAGGPGPAITVPPDRAPPVSYLLDAACNATLCGTALHFRLLHLLITMLGAGVLLLTVMRRLGGVAVTASAVVLFLSPKLVEYAVEIRPYPIFVALTCVQIALVVALVDARQLRIGRLMVFAAIGLIAIYTHFFGLVSTMALFGGLFVARVRTWREGLLIGSTAMVVLALSAGLIPFVAGANAISQAPLAANEGSDVSEFLLKLVGQSATLLSMPTAVIFFGAFAVLIVSGITRVVDEHVHDGWRARGTAGVALVGALVLGLAVTLIASTTVRGFDPLKTSYSIWTLPVLAWLAGAACAPAAQGGSRLFGHVLVRVARVAAVIFGVAALIAQALFATHAIWFVHGPESAIAAAVGPQASGVAVVYRGDNWGFGYFPTVWRYRGQMRQWALTDNGTVHPLVRAAIDPRVSAGDPFGGDRRVVMVDITPRGYGDLQPLLDGAPADPQMAPASPPAGFFLVSQTTLPGLYWTTVTVFERRGA